MFGVRLIFCVRMSRYCFIRFGLDLTHFLKTQAELKAAEYQKLARKLKLIPVSAENACGNDFEIRPFECGPGSMSQHKTQIQVLLSNDVAFKSVGLFYLDGSQLNSVRTHLHNTLPMLRLFIAIRCFGYVILKCLYYCRPLKYDL